MKKNKSKYLKKLRAAQLKFGALLTLALIQLPVITKADQPQIITGTINLVNTASTWVMVISPIVGALFGGYHAIRKSTCDDDMEIKKHEKMIKNAITGVVIALSISGIVTFVSGYYS